MYRSDDIKTALRKIKQTKIRLKRVTKLLQLLHKTIAFIKVIIKTVSRI